MSDYKIDWSDVVFSSKKTINALSATFIAAPRELSLERFVQMVKTYLPHGNIVLGLAKETFIDGFDGQAHFRTLQETDIANVIDKVNKNSQSKVYILNYHQKEAIYIYKSLRFKRVVLVNGSWHRSFHLRPEYPILQQYNQVFDFVSPFTDESEAKRYAETHAAKSTYVASSIGVSDKKMLKEVENVAGCSYDTSYQVGAIIAKKKFESYEAIISACNTVLPYETFAWHYGSSREKHRSQPGDLSHYDSVHAEIAAIIGALHDEMSLQDTSLFINVLPCPTCAKAICLTGITEVVYVHDHSNGYSVALLESKGKIVRRVVNLHDAV